MQDDGIRVAVDDGVAEIVLDRPARLNALDEPMSRALETAFLALENSPEVRAVLLRGEGRVFCAGGDVKQMKELAGAGRASEFFEAPLQAINAAVISIAACPKPVIAALHGAVAGAGLNLALAADIRIAASDSRFNQAFVRLGLVPDTGGTFTLPALVGPARAAELCFTGDFIDAQTAERWGLVNRLVPPEQVVEEAHSLARRIAEGPPDAIAKTKRLLQCGWAEALGEQAERERQAQIECADGSEFEEGIAAFFEKRPPRFTGADSGRGD